MHLRGIVFKNDSQVVEYRQAFRQVVLGQTENGNRSEGARSMKGIIMGAERSKDKVLLRVS